MPNTVAAIASAVSNFALSAGSFVGNTLVAVGVPTNIAVAAATATVYAVDALIYLAPTLAAAAVRPDVPTPESARLTLRTSRPVRFTGTGRARIGGSYMLYEAIDVESFDVLALHDGRVDAFEQWWLNDDAVTVDGSGWVQAIDRKYKNDCARLQWRSGLATETAYSDITTALGTDVWPSTARGDGIASVYLYANAPAPENFLARFPNGLPTVTVTARLSRVFDPRDTGQSATDASTWAWSDNPVLGLLFYLCFFEGGPRLSYDRYFAPTLARCIRAADICDQLVAQATGGSQKRYRQGGGWTWDTAPSAVIGRYLDCMDGWLAANGDGALVVFAGRLYPPAVVLNEDHISGYSLQLGQRRETAADALTISFSSPAHRYNMVETTPWPSREALAAAPDENIDAISLAWVQNNSQARRLGKRAYLRRNVGVGGSLTVDLFPDDGTDVLGERYLRVMLAAPYPASLRDLVIEVQDIEFDLMAGTATIAWIKADLTMDDWDAATEEGDGPTVADPVDTVDLGAPAVISAGYEAVGDDYHLKALVTGLTDPTLSWLLRWRPDGAGSWTVLDATPTVVASNVSVQADLPTPPGSVVEVQVSFITAAGGQSEWGDDPPDTVDMTGL